MSANSGTKTYSADQVVIYFNGQHIDSGFADGEFLKITRQANQWEDSVGTDGEVTRYRVNDNRATIELMLSQTSAFNDVLEAIATLDANAENGAGVGLFHVVDLNGRSVYRAPQTWISKKPEVSFGRATTGRAWTFRCGTLKDSTGGSAVLP